MIHFLERVALSTIIFCLSFLIFYEPAFATTVAFQSPGVPGQEGVLTGSVTYDPNSVRDALNKIESSGGLPGVLSLNELGAGSDFSFEYTSPHSGVKHSVDTICARNIYDLNNGLPENEVLGGKEGPFFDFSDNFELASVDFRSCVGSYGDSNSSISDRDPRVVFSELESQYNQLKLVENDYGGIRSKIFTQRVGIDFKPEEN